MTVRRYVHVRTPTHIRCSLESRDWAMLSMLTVVPESNAIQSECGLLGDRMCFSLSSSKDILFFHGWETEREGERYRLVAFSYAPQLGIVLAVWVCGYVCWPGIKPLSFRSTAQCSNKRSHTGLGGTMCISTSIAFPTKKCQRGVWNYINRFSQMLAFSHISPMTSVVQFYNIYFVWTY